MISELFFSVPLVKISNNNIKNRLDLLEVSEPPDRKPGIKVEDVESLVDKLKNEAKIL